MVYKEGETVANLYLIKSGEFEIKKYLKYAVHKDLGIKILNKIASAAE